MVTFTHVLEDNSIYKGSSEISMIYWGYPAKRALSAMRKHGG